MYASKYFLSSITFLVIAIRVNSNWIPYRGLWYYISDIDDKVNYTEAMERCDLLNGRLAVLPSGSGPRSNLSTFIGSIKRWVNLNNGTACVISSTLYGNSGVEAEIKDPGILHGYVCDWQCHSLGVYQQTRYQSTIDGIYTLEQSNQVRQRYVSSIRIRIFHRRVVDEPPCWYIDNDYDLDSSYAKRPSLWDFTPYNNIHGWNISAINSNISFFCHDCDTLLLNLKNSSISETKILFKSANHGELKFIEYGEDSWIEYQPITNKWCVQWEELFTFCGIYIIAPTISYETTLVGIYENITHAVSISCVTQSLLQTTKQSTEQSTVTETATSNIVQETSVHNTYSQYSVHSSSDKMLRSTESQTTESYNESQEQTENPPDTTTMFLVVGCAIGGVIIIVIVITVVLVRRRKNKESIQNIQLNAKENIATADENVYSSNPNANSIPTSNLTNVVSDLKGNKPDIYGNHEYASVNEQSTNENLYSVAEDNELRGEHVYINSGNVSKTASSNVQSSIASPYIAGQPTHVRKQGLPIDAARTRDDGVSEAQYYNNRTFDLKDNSNPIGTIANKNLPVRNLCDSDIELYNNSIYDGSDKRIGQGKGELIYDDKDDEIEIYDNDLYGS